MSLLNRLRVRHASRFSLRLKFMALIRCAVFRFIIWRLQIIVNKEQVRYIFFVLSRREDIVCLHCYVDSFLWDIFARIFWLNKPSLAQLRQILINGARFNIFLFELVLQVMLLLTERDCLNSFFKSSVRHDFDMFSLKDLSRVNTNLKLWVGFGQVYIVWLDAILKLVELLELLISLLRVWILVCCWSYWALSYWIKRWNFSLSIFLAFYVLLNLLARIFFV